MSNPYETAKDKKASIIGPSLKFKGELSADEDLLIEGEIEGSIRHTSNLTIGKEGKIKANVSAEYISVEGTVKGDLTSRQSVTIHESANIDGNIFSPTVSLLEGATFNGSIDMTGKGEAHVKPEDKPEDKQGSRGAQSSTPAPANQAQDEKADSLKKSVKPQKTSTGVA